MVEMNATYAASTAMINPEIAGWGITAGIFITIIVMIFVISKNFRRLCYGLVFTIIGTIIYSLSRFIGKSTAQGDYTPMYGFLWAIGLIVISIVNGYVFLKTKLGKELEKKWR